MTRVSQPIAGCMLAGALLVSAGGWGQPMTAQPMPAPAPSAASEAVLENPTAAPGGPVDYQEYSVYSATVRRSYVPGYTPHPTSLYLNPRTYPAAKGPLATPYNQYGGKPGWFFCSPNGYQSLVPPDSHALAYNRGELGITSRLGRGYPDNQQVIMPVLKPVEPVAEKAGVFISAGGPGIRLETGPPSPYGDAPQADRYIRGNEGAWSSSGPGVGQTLEK